MSSWRHSEWVECSPSSPSVAKIVGGRKFQTIAFRLLQTLQFLTIPLSLNSHLFPAPTRCSAGFLHPAQMQISQISLVATANTVCGPYSEGIFLMKRKESVKASPVLATTDGGFRSTLLSIWLAAIWNKSGTKLHTSHLHPHCRHD